MHRQAGKKMSTPVGVYRYVACSVFRSHEVNKRAPNKIQFSGHHSTRAVFLPPVCRGPSNKRCQKSDCRHCAKSTDRCVK